MAKIKLLLVVTEFWQAGCQRYNFEVDKSIDKDKFDVEILSYRSLNTNPEWADYYYPQHVELGTKINFFDSFVKSKSVFSKEKFNEDKFENFIDSYDFVIFQGEYCWRRFSQYLKYNPKKFFVSIHNSIVQVEDNYQGFDKSIPFNFISPYTKEQAKIEFSEFEKYSFYNFPLSISAKWEEKWASKPSSGKKIGVFTRITPGKPIEPFLYAFQAVLQKHPEATLHIYGTGDPTSAGLTRHLEILNISDKVIFEGHATNMIESVINDSIELVFFHGYHYVPGGFASFQLSAAGVPQIFFEMIPQKIFEKNEAMYFTNSISLFANKASQLLDSPSDLQQLASSQFKTIKEERDVEKTIKGYEEYLLNFNN